MRGILPLCLCKIAFAEYSNAEIHIALKTKVLPADDTYSLKKPEMHATYTSSQYAHVLYQFFGKKSSKIFVTSLFVTRGRAILSQRDYILTIEEKGTFVTRGRAILSQRDYKL